MIEKMNEQHQKKGKLELLIQGAIKVNKFYLEHLIKQIWEKCPNCNTGGNFILIQKRGWNKAKNQVGWYDEIQCDECGYAEDITDVDTW